MTHPRPRPSRRYRGLWESRRGFLLVFLIVVCIVTNMGFTWLAGIRLSWHESAPSSRLGGSLLADGNPGNQNLTPRRRWQQTMPPMDSSESTAGFIHLGKTGGSTISKLLRNGCTSFVQGPCRNVTNESVVSKFVEHYYHIPDFHRLPTAKHKAFIISVRDVFDRTVSSFLYHHPNNSKTYNLKQTQSQKVYGPLAYECFETLEAFSALMNGNSSECNYPYAHNVVDANDCPALACAALHGKVRFFTHLFFNYRNILYTKLPTTPPRQIYVLRQEKLWEDWTALNRLLGQAGPVVIPTSDSNQRNVSGLSLPVTRDISLEGRKKLCKALETEYMAYFHLMNRAVNMDQDNLESCRQIAQKNCPNLDTISMLKHL